MSELARILDEEENAEPRPYKDIFADTISGGGGEPPVVGNSSPRMELMRQFAAAYVRTNSAAAAARAVGLDPHNSARWMNKRGMRELVQEEIRKIGTRPEVIGARLTQMAGGLPEDCYRVEGDQVSIDFEAVERHGLKHLIRKISYDRNGNQVVEFADPLPATKLLTNLWGLGKQAPGGDTNIYGDGTLFQVIMNADPGHVGDALNAAREQARRPGARVSGNSREAPRDLRRADIGPEVVVEAD